MRATNSVRNLVGMDRDEAVRILKLYLPKILLDVKTYPKSFPENPRELCSTGDKLV